jgi:hypothetical protein
MIRAEFKRINRPRMTLSRYLPTTAKHMEKARPKTYFGNKMLPNPDKPVAINKPLPQVSTTTIQHQEKEGRPGKWNQAPEDYDISELQDYDADYLKEIVKMQSQEIEALKKEVAMLKENNEALFQVAKKGVRIT